MWPVILLTSFVASSQLFFRTDANPSPPLLSQHPVRSDLVEEIKTKTKTWVPYEVSENLLSTKNIEYLSQMLANSGSSFMKSNLLGADFFNPFGSRDPTVDQPEQE